MNHALSVLPQLVRILAPISLLIFCVRVSYAILDIFKSIALLDLSLHSDVLFRLRLCI